MSRRPGSRDDFARIAAMAATAAALGLNSHNQVFGVVLALNPDVDLKDVEKACTVAGVAVQDLHRELYAGINETPA